jgi:hypothetical protein
MTPAVIERAAARLADGGWRYTPRQLYYAVCADLEKPQRSGARSLASGEVGLGAVLILIALILIRFAIPFTILLALGLLLIVTGAAARLQRTSPPRVRVLAMSYDEFVHELGDRRFEGLLVAETEELRQVANVSVSVLCDTHETARCVNANREKLAIDGLAALPAEAVGSPAAKSIPIIALHDASPRGCALVLDLKDQGLDAIDAGLRPLWVSNDANQVVEGAPARLPRDLSEALTADEIDWLRSGRRVELATLTSSEIAQLIQRAASKLY